MEDQLIKAELGLDKKKKKRKKKKIRRAGSLVYLAGSWREAIPYLIVILIGTGIRENSEWWNPPGQYRGRGSDGSMMMVRVLTSLLTFFQPSQDNHWYMYICSVNDRIYGGENDRARTPAARQGNRTPAARLQIQCPTA